MCRFKIRTQITVHLPTFPNLVSVFGLAVIFCTATIVSLIFVWRFLRSCIYSKERPLAALSSIMSPILKLGTIVIAVRDLPLTDTALLDCLIASAFNLLHTSLLHACNVTR